MTRRIGFLGAGRMTTALAKGLIESKFAVPESIIASDPLATARETFQKHTGAEAVDRNQEVIDNSEVLVLAVKPQGILSVLQDIAPRSKPNQLIVSIAAGVTLATLESVLKGSRVVRVMPNTPSLVGAGASGFSRGTQATEEDAELVARMLGTVGLAIEVPESLLDAVTGLSGSGPAYVFEIIEALSDGGVLVGLPRETATKLAAQTLLGAAKMVLETGQHPGQLKDAVTSPGGTTIAGLHELEKGSLRGTLMNAVRSATERARELGRT